MAMRSNNPKKKRFFDGYTLLLFAIVVLVILALPVSHPFTGSVSTTAVTTDLSKEGCPPTPPEGILLDESGCPLSRGPFLLVQGDVSELKEAQSRLAALSEEITEVNTEIAELQDRLKKHTVRLEQLYKKE